MKPLLTQEQRARLEVLADELEAIGRTEEARETKEHMNNIAPRIPSDLFALAWNVKQIARWNTPSFGV